jgi:hypothetical protein
VHEIIKLIHFSLKHPFLFHYTLQIPRSDRPSSLHSNLLPSSVKCLPNIPMSSAVKQNKLMQTNSFILQVTASNPPLLHSTLGPKIRFPLESPFLSAIPFFRAPEQVCGSRVLSLRRLRCGSLLYTCSSFNKYFQSDTLAPCLKLPPFRLLSEKRKEF